MAITKIDAYEVMYSSNTFVPRIWLKAGGRYIGQLIFKPNGSVLPSDSQGGGQTNLYYHLDDYQNAVDLLRNEAPMYLLYSAPSGENGIKTTEEVVGEGETR